MAFLQRMALFFVTNVVQMMLPYDNLYFQLIMMPGMTENDKKLSDVVAWQHNT